MRKSENLDSIATVAGFTDVMPRMLVPEVVIPDVGVGLTVVVGVVVAGDGVVMTGVEFVMSGVVDSSWPASGSSWPVSGSSWPVSGS